MCSSDLVLLPRWRDRLPWLARLSVVPGSILVLVLATLACQGLGLNVETIGSRFGGIPNALPAFAWPDFSWDTAKFLLMPATTLALLGAIESLLCARIADQMIGDRHDANQELMAQGIANFVTPFFGGMPATGTIARTVTNVKNGATSPMAGVVHALTLLAVILVAAPLANSIPLAALSAILMFVAWNMGEWHAFVDLKQFRLPYRATLLSVFVLTVVVDLTVAVEVGLIAACLTGVLSREVGFLFLAGLALYLIYTYRADKKGMDGGGALHAAERIHEIGDAHGGVEEIELLAGGGRFLTT